MIEKIILKDFKITYNDFKVTILENFEEESISYKEDMLQIEFDQYIIDVGWYYHNDKKDGKFAVTLIEDYMWESPILLYRTKFVDKLPDIINYFIDFVLNPGKY